MARSEYSHELFLEYFANENVESTVGQTSRARLVSKNIFTTNF